MICKVVEIRDSGTFIPAMAIKLGPENDQERWLLARAGYGRTAEEHGEYVFLAKIAGGEPCSGHIDQFAWGTSPRTYYVVHDWLLRHFDEVPNGGVVDVEFILGETDAPKESERLEMQRMGYGSGF